MQIRVGRLCRNLGDDPDLRRALQPGDALNQLADAVKRGADTDALTALLDAVEDVAASAGIDGVTTGDRQYEALPDVSVRTVRGWRCPHTHPCDRVETGRRTPVCALTSDELAPVKVISG
ncbi:hypothetical protein GCM10011609_35110 [Lentzea pudingi]|uniref:Uncharacterized protein n=1 Tax=Lentzea pudingi TaxID=1789439 RepID=A0ABQ2HYN9_9PSEU|nr:hypothetical protein [Lentzea pudingi]GGM94608.1 hypothetical protein GCM10011609_35110 [Lentzea pudingi]